MDKEDADKEDNICNEILAIKENEISPFGTTWVDLEGIMWSEISYTRERQILYDIIYMWNI